MHSPNTKSILAACKSLMTQKEDDTTWLRIDNTLASVTDYTVIPEIEPLIISSMLSDRSKLSGTALTLLKNAAASEHQLDFTHFVPPLFRLIGRSKKVFSVRGEDTLMAVINRIPRPFAFLKENCASLNKNVRLVSFKCLEEYVKRSQDEEVFVLVENGLKDAFVEVRMVCKRVMKDVRGTVVEEEKPELRIRRPLYVKQEKEGFFRSIPRKAKEVLESIRSYSPFRKQVKTNDSIGIKTNGEVICEVVEEKKEAKRGVEKKEGINHIKRLSETPKKERTKDLSMCLTPRKLQEYINKYNTEHEIERKYLIKSESNEKCENSTELNNEINNNISENTIVKESVTYEYNYERYKIIENFNKSTINLENSIISEPLKIKEEIDTTKKIINNSSETHCDAKCHNEEKKESNTVNNINPEDTKLIVTEINNKNSSNENNNNLILHQKDVSNLKESITNFSYVSNNNNIIFADKDIKNDAAIEDDNKIDSKENNVEDNKLLQDSKLENRNEHNIDNDSIEKNLKINETLASLKKSILVDNQSELENKNQNNNAKFNENECSIENDIRSDKSLITKDEIDNIFDSIQNKEDEKNIGMQNNFKNTLNNKRIENNIIDLNTINFDTSFNNNTILENLSIKENGIENEITIVKEEINIKENKVFNFSMINENEINSSSNTDMPLFTESHVSANFSKLSLIENISMKNSRIEDSFKNLSVTENDVNNTFCNINDGENNINQNCDELVVIENNVNKIIFNKPDTINNLQCEEEFNLMGHNQSNINKEIITINNQCDNSIPELTNNDKEVDKIFNIKNDFNAKKNFVTLEKINILEANCEESEINKTVINDYTMIEPDVYAKRDAVIIENMVKKDCDGK
ncbi:hypothetical protein COBT_001768 [Conglomerata obtusa]